MKSYARIERGVYVELISPAVYDAEHPGWQIGDPSRIGDEIPIDLRFNPEFVSWLVEITDLDPQPELGWLYADGVFSPAPIPGASPTELAASARAQRDQLLRETYDPGINMALRALRMATSPEEKTYAEGKIIELDNFAQALEDIPEQSGFPQEIDWPTIPEK